MTADLSAYDRVRAYRYVDDRLLLLDQRWLPHQQQWVECADIASLAAAIHALIVRGAPAIGIAAAYGLAMACRQLDTQAPPERRAAIESAAASLIAARPTAVNLAWAVQRMLRVLTPLGFDAEAALAEARAIESEDLAANYRMAAAGAGLIAPGSGVLTHCNTGSLATAGLGTALGVVRAAYAQGKLARVYAGETRPWNQGSRLTAWELLEDGIPVQLIADSAAAHLMKTGAVQWVIVGADRICANGDTANKIGTYAHAISAKHHGVKVMVVAPSSTVDMATKHGDDIEIELRDSRELLFAGDRRVVAEGIAAWNPVFDVTPGSLIDVIVTEKGVIEHPDEARMRAVFGAA
jgi:methylthioribose-1-phosphate isomerase